MTWSGSRRHPPGGCTAHAGQADVGQARRDLIVAAEHQVLDSGADLLVVDHVKGFDPAAHRARRPHRHPHGPVPVGFDDLLVLIPDLGRRAATAPARVVPDH